MKKITAMVLLLMTACNSTSKYAAVAEKVLPSVVTISVGVIDPETQKSGMVSGAGVFVPRNGHILTCAHLFSHKGMVKEAITVEAYQQGVYFAELLSIDTKRDLALIKINAYTPCLHIADPWSVIVGQEVLAIGEPLGLEGSVSHGIVSATTRDVFGQYNLVQTDAAINPGNSGGPLVNMEGQIIGINVLLANAAGLPLSAGIGFAVSSGQILEFLVKYRGLEFIFDRLESEYTVSRSNYADNRR